MINFFSDAYLYNMKEMSVGIQDALRLLKENIKPLSVETVSPENSVDRVAASDIYSLIDSPGTDSSRKDGYAVISHEVADATPDKPVRLQLIGSMAAGGTDNIQIRPGTTVRVLTGAQIPTGADGVVADEFTEAANDWIVINAYAEPKNILRAGSDTRVRDRLVLKGSTISPVTAGLLTVAGHGTVSVCKSPVVGIIGTGDELVKPGDTLKDGQLYASNVITLAAWCRRYGMCSFTEIVRDDAQAIRNALGKLLDKTDAILTSGGAWTGDYDLVEKTLDELGWRKMFHRIRIGPGKATGFGTLRDKPIFILPGGPPSNIMGFVEIALPGLFLLSGQTHPVLPFCQAKLSADLTDGKREWSDFFFGNLTGTEGNLIFRPMNKRSRLSSIAAADAIGIVPEGMDCLKAGTLITVQILNSPFCRRGFYDISL